MFDYYDLPVFISYKKVEELLGVNHWCFISDQLSRLHMILKPFMLRRIKRDVENELSEKVSDVYRERTGNLF